MPHVDFTHNWHITVAGRDPLAARELQAALARLTGREVPITPQPPDGAPVLALSYDEGGGDGFTWQAAPTRIDLHGGSPRGLLYAVYDFLEALGWRWPAPGVERVPTRAAFDLPDGPVAQSPALAGRCLILGHHAFMADAAQWIEWAARNRLNTIFFHTLDEPLALGAMPESQYLAHREEAVGLARERGMVIEHGGHGLAALLPRDLFGEMPDAFRMKDGQRTADHNFCVSSAEGLAIIRQNARAHFEAHPEVDVFHVWPDDIEGGGWCGCEQCAPYSASEQALIAANALGEALEAVNPAAQVSFIAYHDTEDVPLKVTPRGNVCLLWAPRKRCYAHPTDDPACPVNTPHYAETFRGQVAHINTAGAPPARVFEYYLDGILFKSALPPLPSVVQRDLRFYRDAGAHTVQALLTGDHPFSAPEANPWLFARLAWDPDQDVDALLRDFGAAALGGGSGEAFAAYVRTLERAYALALDLDPRQIELQLVNAPLTILADPPIDMGDPINAPPDALHDKAARADAIPGLLAEAESQLEAARAGADPAAWADQRALFDLHRCWLEFDAARVRLYDALAYVPLPDDARARYVAAQAACDRALGWGRAHIADPRYRANFDLLHWTFWKLRLNKIGAEHFASKCDRLTLRVGSLLHMWAAMRRVTGMYEE